MKKIIISVLLAVALVVIPVSSALAETSQEVTVTATPTFICIAIAQNTWTINGIDGDEKIDKGTTYFSNDTGETGDVTPPSETVDIGECYFVIVNTSTVATDITANMVHFTGGDAMQNSNAGYEAGGEGVFGASTYITGATWPDHAVTLENSGSDALKENLTASADIEFGVAIEVQTDDFLSASAMTSTITVTATEYSAS